MVLFSLAGGGGCEAAFPVASSTASGAPAGLSSAPEPIASGISSATEERPVGIFVGRLKLTKGEQPMVGGRLVSSDSFEERFGVEWRKLLAGRRVRVTGREHVHVCGPDEQCLSDGEIPQILDVRMIEVCASPSAALLAGPRSVPCPPTGEEERACAAECDEQSRACDGVPISNGGAGPRRCGCARETCVESCATSGEVDFRCH